MAVCGLIENYSKFAKDNEGRDLSEFEAFVFGGIVADIKKVPGTFDALEQLTALARKSGEIVSRLIFNRRAAAGIICDRLPFPDCAAILRRADHLGAPTSATGCPVSPSAAENVSWLCSVSSSSRVAIDEHGTRADAATIPRTAEIRVVPQQP